MKNTMKLKNLKLTSLVVTGVLCCSAPVIATEQYVNMMMQQLAATGKTKQIAQCSGKSEQKVENIYKDSLSACLDKHGLDNPSFESCFKNKALAELGVTESHMDSCMPSDGDNYDDKDYYEENHPLDAKADEINERIQALYDKEHISDADKRKIAALEAQLDDIYQRQAQEALSQAEDDLNDTMAMMQTAANQSNLTQINLPIYPGSQVMVHISQAGEMELAGQTLQTLPAATLSSSDSFEKVDAFYRKNLAKFKRFEDGKERVIYMQSAPDNFDVLKDLSIYTSTPHVSISKAVKSSVAPDAEVAIEIAYKK